MGNTARLRFTGLDKMQHLLHAYGQDVVRAAYEDVSETTRRTAERTAAAAPVESGDLVKSITAIVRTDGYVIRGRVRVGVDYAAHLEFGTEKTPKHPHLVPAAVDERKQLQARLIDSVIEHTPAELGKPRIVGRDAGLPGIHIE
jgi:HK97 gp10 family phage protein